MKKPLTKSYQQGDLILHRLNTLPPGEVKIIAKSKLVLAHGESGHSHVVEDDDAELIQIGEQMLMRLKNVATVKHEEHNAPNSLLPEPERLAPGIWEIGRVKEYDWFAQMSRQVID
jgi:hypothetical protein